MAATSKVTNTIPEKLKALEAAYLKALSKGLVKAGAQLLKFTDEYVPVETGEMKRSGYVRLEKDGINSKVAVGFSVPYAVYVHEDPDKAHGEAYNIKHANAIKAGTKMEKGPLEQFKFLTKPAQEHSAELQKTIADELKTVKIK